MSWFLVVLLTSGVGDLHDGFLWYDPFFASETECQLWTMQNIQTLRDSLTEEFGPGWEADQVLCVREDRLKDIGMQPYVEGENI